MTQYELEYGLRKRLVWYLMLNQHDLRLSLPVTDGTHGLNKVALWAWSWR